MFPYSLHMSRYIYIIYRIIFLCFICVTLSACFTGIESTKKITLSREDKRQSLPTPEETYLDRVSATPNTEWPVGKPFFVADEKATIMIDAGRNMSGRVGLERGDTLIFRDARSVRTPDGTVRTTLIFSRGEDEFRYMARETAKNETVVMSDAIPGLIDTEMVNEVSQIMVGNQYWTLSQLWLDEKGERIDGLKFDPVTIEAVDYGTMVFPLKVRFMDKDGRKGEYLMNFRSGGTDSRGFANLFSLTDPRFSYPGIEDENWQLIQKALVAPGMTKMECRLAKGNPSDVYDGHDYSRLLLLWVYPDATTLYFEDDILVRVKGY